MSDAVNYAHAGQVALQRLGGGEMTASDERITTRIRQRAQKQAAELNELANGVEQLANQLFGMLPQSPNPPTQGSDLGRVEPVRPQMDAIEQAQYLIDEALESLRRQLSRLASL